MFVTRLYQRSIRSLVLFGSCLLISACSQFPVLFQNKQQQVTQLLEQQQFYPALDLIDQTPSTAPDYQELVALRPQVLQSIENYEQSNLTEADKLIKSGQWGKALATLEQALQHVPASKQLLKKHASTSTHINQQLETLWLELALQRAKTLPKETQLLEKIETYQPSDAIRQNIISNQQDSLKASELLLAEAKRLIKQQDLQHAYQYAQLSSQLSNNKESEKLITEIDQSIRASKIQTLKKAMDEKDLIKAKVLAERMSAYSEDKELKPLLEKLKQELALTILQLSRDGQQAYTQGNIDKAIEYWEQAIKLDKNNTDIAKLLERAKAFQNNYRRFKQN